MRRAARIAGQAMLVTALLAPIATLAMPAPAAAAPTGLASSYTITDLGAGVPDTDFDTASAWVNRAGGFVVYDRLDGSTPVAVRYNINTGITTVLPSGFFAVGVTDTGEVAGDRGGAAAWWSSGVEHPVAGASGRPVDLSTSPPFLLAVNGGGLAAGHGRATCYNSDDSVGTCAPSDMPVTSNGGAAAVPSSQTPCANPSFVYCTALQVTPTIGAGVNDLNEVVGVDTSSNIATWTGTGAPAAVPGLIGFRGQVMAFNKNDDMIVHKNSLPGYYFYSATSGLVPIQGTLGGLTGDPGHFISEGLNDAGVVVGLASLTDSRGNPVHKAFGWTVDNGPIDLQPLVTNLSAAGFADLGTPVAINDLGDIVGYASKNSDGLSHFYLLHPGQQLPTVTSVDPTTGTTAGGTDVTVHGTNFDGVTGIDFGDAAASSFTCAAQTCTVTSPPHAAGPVDVRVTNAGGTSASNPPADQFTYEVEIAITTPPAIERPATGTTTTLDFPVTLSDPSNDTVTVDYGTENDTALAGTDYTATSGTLTFDPGVTDGTIPVTILGAPPDGSELQFSLVIGNEVNATVSVDQAVGTIDGTITLEVPDTHVFSQPNTQQFALFTATLTQPVSQPVTFAYATEDGSAIAGTDYTASSGTVTFHPGQTSRKIKIPVRYNPNSSGAVYFRLDFTDVQPDWVLFTPDDGIATATITKGVIGTNITPNKGSPGGGGHITVKGSGFGPPGSDAQLLFCSTLDGDGNCDENTTEPADTVTVVNDNTITGVTPAFPTDPNAVSEDVNVQIVLFGDDSDVGRSDPTTLTYTYRVIGTKITPNKGSPAGGAHITVKGSGFGPPDTGTDTLAQLRFCSTLDGDGNCDENTTVLADHVTVVNDNTITAVTPAFPTEPNAVSEDVNVQIVLFEGSQVGQSDPTTLTYTYRVTATKITPNKGSPAGGASVTVKGSGFGQAGGTVDVEFCVDLTPDGDCGASNAASAVTVINDNTITFKTPMFTGGISPQAVYVEVQVYPFHGGSELGQSDPTTLTYTYDVTATKITPNKGSPAGGASVTVKGSGFGQAGGTVDVEFCVDLTPDGDCGASNAASAVTVINDNTITFKTPMFTGGISPQAVYVEVQVYPFHGGSELGQSDPTTLTYTYQ